MPDTPDHTLGPLPEDIEQLDEAYPGTALADQVRAYALAEVAKARADERERFVLALRSIKAGGGNPEFVYTSTRDLIAEYSAT